MKDYMTNNFHEDYINNVYKKMANLTEYHIALKKWRDEGKTGNFSNHVIKLTNITN